MPLTPNSFANISLDSAGLVALADLSTISERCALLGTSWWTDVLFLAPGIHRHQNASEVNGGELPDAAAMTSGYVFRIENQATVFWLQRIGRPGCLANARVERVNHDLKPQYGRPPLTWPSLIYATGITLTVVGFAILVYIRDFWGVSVLGMLAFARALNVFVLRRRAVEGWKGAKEPGVKGDLLVVLSQDRWVRLRGAVDDLKLVTSGQWVRDTETYENFAVACATLLVYCAAALAANASTLGSFVIVVLLLSSVALLAVCNALTQDLHMFDCRVFVSEEPKPYKRRVHMAEEMIEEHGGRRDWAVQMGLVLSPLVPQQEHKAVQAAVAACSDSPSPSDIHAAPPTTTSTPASATKLPSSPPSFSLRSETTDNPVDHQAFYEGPYCITSSQADRRITDMDLLLTELNTVHGTAYSFEDVEDILMGLLEKNYDFGMIYGLLRRWWLSLPGRPSSLLVHFQELKHRDTEARLAAVSAEMITDPMFTPRRVWDLYSNRVLPIWAIEIDPLMSLESAERFTRLYAVSHAWFPPLQRQNVDTPINGHKWPVPIPADTSLTDIRIELLNLGAEYVWLDVLCLRQEGGAPDEDAHRNGEWKIDVPTIQEVYVGHTVVVYLSGLGRPFVEGNLESETHWCNRAWTLQELYLAKKNMTVAGVTAHSPKFELTKDGPMADGPEGGFEERLASKITTDTDIMNFFNLVAAMRQRRATREVDRIAGLAFWFAAGPKLQPAFYQRDTVGAAWLRFVRIMSSDIRADLFFFFPAAGESAAGESTPTFKWLPSWKQLLEVSEKLTVGKEIRNTSMYQDKNSPLVEPDESFYTCQGVLVPSCHIAGFKDSTDFARRGTISFEVAPNQWINLDAIAYHRNPIPNGSYAAFSNLCSFNRKVCRYWVLGALDVDEKQFSKMTVLQIRGSDLKAKLYMPLDLCKVENDDDINMASKWVRKVVLA